MNHTSRIVATGPTATRKRKDREDSLFYSHKGSFVNKQPHHYQHQKYSNATSSQNPRMMVSEPGVNSNNPNPGSSNRILAGYMAYEFLTKGTLLGQKFDPARAEAMPVSAAEPKRRPGGVEPEVVLKKPNRNYAEVAQLVKGVDGAHIPGIVNPTQLARWIQM